MVEVVAGVVRNSSGEVLLAQHGPLAKLAHKWEFPGGKIEPGESAAEALVRELVEELNIRVTAVACLGSFEYRYPWAHIGLVAMAASCAEPEELRLLEHVAAKWVGVDDLLKFDLAPADRPIAELLQTGCNII